MDKRIGWNLDSAEHATFNWIRPIPTCSKVASQFEPPSAAVLDEAGIITARNRTMREFKRRIAFQAGLVLFILFWATALGPEPSARILISPNELVRAVTIQRESLIELCLLEHVDPNGHDAQGRTPLLIATSQQDWKTARRLMGVGALVDLADKNGFTPLMAAARHANLEIFRELLTRSSDLHVEARCKDGSDLLAMAIDGGNPEIVRSVVERWPAMTEWRSSTRRALQTFLTAGDKNGIRLLLGKHSSPPTPEGKNVPLLAYAIAENDSSLFTTLLSCGTDPNTVLPSHCDEDFLALFPTKSFTSYVEGDRGLTVLMLAAGLDKEDYLRALLKAGASRNQLTNRNKMSALDIAAETGHWRSSQILLGGGPPPDQLRVEISLALQRVALVKNGVPVYRTQCSTGRQGYATRRGDFVITNKERNHRSTIYHVEMPYFMRLSCLDFGMHAGIVPNYPASHGCIRLPEEAARKFFSEIPVGTLVTVQ
ncbi:MAG TPA: ankyrin repeat domain-containing protein [Candidatus Udaeobacter sp.]|jgi:ankyrin repeat protein|nr:ankyrin repeat domain-containing protein [Candidatus Udaeobacter sp.]